MIANKKTQDEISPEKAIELLKEGNQRFLEAKQTSKDLLNEVKTTATGQYPFACLLGCIDSRVPGETVFDLGIGDVFDVRIAGNFVNTDILGSMEFACKVAGSKLIVVLGHTQCGAIKGACDGVELGNLTPMLSNFDEVIDNSGYQGDKSSKNGEYVDLITTNNIAHTVNKIRKDSPILNEMEQNKEIKIIGGLYDVSNGKVEFYDSL